MPEVAAARSILPAGHSARNGAPGFPETLVGRVDGERYWHRRAPSCCGGSHELPPWLSSMKPCTGCRWSDQAGGGRRGDKPAAAIWLPIAESSGLISFFPFRGAQDRKIVPVAKLMSQVPQAVQDRRPAGTRPRG